jgi:hypothetical protein
MRNIELRIANCGLRIFASGSGWRGVLRLSKVFFGENAELWACAGAPLVLFSGLRMKKKDPADRKAAKKKPTPKKPAAKQASKSSVQPAAGKSSKPKAAQTKAGIRPTSKPEAEEEMTAAEAEARFGTWAAAAMGTEEEYRAMADEFWLVLNEPEELRKRSPIAHIMGVHEGRRPEKVHLHIKAGKSVAYIRSRQWHPTEDWRENPDGSLDYWLEIAPCWQVKRWVLGFGGDVTVLNPPGLEAILIDIAEKIMAMYSKRRGG